VIRVIQDLEGIKETAEIPVQTEPMDLMVQRASEVVREILETMVTEVLKDQWVKKVCLARVVLMVHREHRAILVIGETGDNKGTEALMVLMVITVLMALREPRETKDLKELKVCGLLNFNVFYPNNTIKFNVSCKDLSELERCVCL
jgi:hypothetical protein